MSIVIKKKIKDKLCANKLNVQKLEIDNFNYQKFNGANSLHDKSKREKIQEKLYKRILLQCWFIKCQIFSDHSRLTLSSLALLIHRRCSTKNDFSFVFIVK